MFIETSFVIFIWKMGSLQFVGIIQKHSAYFFRLTYNLYE